jgi:starch-binding outer membrane protein, SusD/RagB family
MKAINKYFLVALTVFATTSCEDFLTENNKSNITAENYFVTASGYESLVNASYSTLRDVWGDDPWLFELGVDVSTRGFSEAVGGSYDGRDMRSRELNEYVNLNPTNPFVADFWADCYRAIQTCNTAIARAGAVTEMAEERKTLLQAEVRFLRAYYYFLLVEQFGNVPIVTEEINGVVTHFERNSEQEVYQFIVNELNEVVHQLPVTAAQFGRVTKGATNNLLALVYLTRGYKSYAAANDFSLAASLADEVINSGAYVLLPTFKEVFNPGNENNKEIIFSVQYETTSITPNNGNGQSAHFGWETWIYGGAGFERENPFYNWKKTQFMPSQFLYSLFNTSIDSRYDATFLSSVNATIDAPAQGVKKGDLRVYFPKWDVDFTAADEAALKVLNPKVEVFRYPTWKQSFNGIGGTDKFPWVNKFHDPKSLFHGNTVNYNSSRDIFLFRLAETYLIAAEAYHKLGDNTTAADRINSVRTRAAIPGQEAAMQIAAGDVTIDLILDERGRELVGEYKRWPDLKRTGKLIERTLLHNNLAKIDDALTEIHLLRPIPQSVIDRDSEEFPQNAGY